MRIRRAAALLVSLSFAVLTASCLQNPTATSEADDAPPSNERASEQAGGAEPTGEARQEIESRPYAPGEFHFVVIVEDDRQGKAAGWQVARETSHFGVLIEDVPVYEWQCNLEIGMPLRTELAGRISSSRAAQLSALVANAVVFPLLASRLTWEHQGALFCIQLEDKMNAMFRGKYRAYGARVRKQ
jgi:hypothetical protein